MAPESERGDAPASGGDASAAPAQRGIHANENFALGFVSIGVAIVVAAVILRLASPREELFTAEVLWKHNGLDDAVPVYLGVLGSVFDVTNGKQHYGKGGAYHHFSGRDASRAFVSGNFTGDGLTDCVDGLSALELKSIGDWRSFYLKSYSYVGKLVGTFYDAQGKATQKLVQIEADIKRGAELVKQKEALEKKHPSCNSRWSQDEGGQVWCSSGYPRKFSTAPTLPSQGAAEIRCACFDKKYLTRPGLEVYEGCEPTATHCKTS